MIFCIRIKKDTSTYNYVIFNCLSDKQHNIIKKPPTIVGGFFIDLNLTK
jgi:hypothetical protein